MKSVLPIKLFDRRHFTIWGGAFFFAVIVWIFVVAEHTYTYELEVPIEVRNIREGKTLTAEIAPTAIVRFKGKGSVFLKAQILKPFVDFKLILDLDRISTTYDFYLNDYYKEYREKVLVPEGINLKFIEIVRPDSIHIALDDYISKQATVQTDFEIFPAPGYIIVGEMKHLPESIELKGPKDIIELIDVVKTEQTKLIDVKYPIKQKLPISIDIPKRELIEVSPSEIEVQAEIQPYGKRIMTEVPIKILNPGEYKVFAVPSSVSLTLSGGVTHIGSLTPDDLGVYIDFKTQWKPTISAYKPTVVTPRGVEWSDLSPKQIELRVERNH